MGSYTIKDVLKITQQFKPNRYDFKERDVIKRVTVKEVKEVERHDLAQEPRVRTKYEITTYSYPQYPPYTTQTGRAGRRQTRRYQRSIRHEYDSILELDRLSLNTYYWRYRLGSEKKWRTRDEVPQNKVKQLYPKTKRLLKRKADRKGRTVQESNRLYKQYVKKHRDRAPYLDVGDFNAQELGINGDFIFRIAWALDYNGHLFGRMYPKLPSTITNPTYTPFFPKHGLRLIEELMKRGVLKDD